MTDAELVRRAKGGDAAAFADLARLWSPRVLALCHARVRRADVAEDLAQETLLRGLRSLHALADDAKFGPWMLGIALRACLDWLKAKERTTVAFSVLGPENAIDELFAEAAPDYETADERRRLMDEVTRLPETFRKVLMLYYYDDFTYRELGELLGVSAATINARLTKARTLLRERLTDCRSRTYEL